MAVLALGLAAALLLGALSLQSPPGLRYVAARLERAAAGAGFETRLSGVALRLLARELRVDELTLGAPGKTPFLTARRVRVRVPLTALFGRVAIDEVEIDSLSVEVRHTAAGTTNLEAAPLASVTETGPARVRAPFSVNRVSVRDARLRLVDEASGSGFDADGLSLELASRAGTLRGALRPTRPLQARIGARSLTLQASELPLDFEHGDLRFGPVVLRTSAGEARAQGVLRDLAGAIDLDVDIDGRFEARGVAPAQAGLAGEVELRARLRGTAAAPRGELTLRAAELALPGLRASDVQLAGTFDRDAVSLASLTATLAGGSFEASARVPWNSGEGECRAEWNGLELTTLLEESGTLPARGPRPAAKLRGRAAAAWPVGTWREARGTAWLLASDGRETEGAAGVEGELRLELGDGAWKLRVPSARGAGLALGGALGGRLADPIASSEIAGRVELQTDDIGRAFLLFGGASPGTKPTGSFAATLDVSGRLREPLVSFRIEGKDVASPDLPSLHAQVHARGTLSRRGVDLESLTLESSAAKAEASGRMDLPSRRLQGSATASLEDLSAFRSLLPAALQTSGALAAEADIEGRWPEVLARVKLHGGPLGIAGQEFTGIAGDLLVDRKAVRLERLDLPPSDGGRVSLSGSLSLDEARLFELRVGLHEADLSQAARARAAAVTKALCSLEADLRGSLAGADRPALDVRLTRLDVEAGANRVALAGPARLTLGPESAFADGLQLRAGATQLELRGRLDATTDSRLSLRLLGHLEDLAPFLAQPSTAAPAGESNGFDVSSLKGALEASVDWTGDPRDPDAVGQVTVTGASAGAFSDLSLGAAYRDGVLDVERLEGRGPGVFLRAHARANAALLLSRLPEPALELWPGQTASASLHLELQAAERGPDEPDAFLAGGTVVADLSTESLSPRSVRGSATVSNVVLRGEGVVLTQQGTGRIEVADGAARISGLEWRGAESALRIGGGAHLAGDTAALGDAVLELHADGDVDLRLLGGAVRGAEGGGTATVRLELSGAATAPELRGEVLLQNGLLRYRPRRLSLDGLSGRLLLADNRLTLDGVTGSINGGRFEARGGLELLGLVPASGRVELVGRGATLDWPRGFLGELDASLAVEIREGETTLSGDVNLVSGSYTGNPRVLYTELEEWQAQPSQPSVLDPLRFELRLRTLQDAQGDTLYGRLGLSADIEVTGHFADPELQGRIVAAPGAELYLGGRSYAVSSLTIDYTKAGGLVPFVRSRAITRISGYEVTADFTGPLDDLSAQLSSDPPLADRQVALLLASGRPSSGGTSTDALSLVAGDILGGVGRSFGFDTVRLESGRDEEFLSADPTAVASEANPQSRLTLTKRLTPDLEVTLSQALADGAKRTTLVTYRPLRGVEVRASQRDDQTFAFELRHDLSFGPAARAEALRRAERASQPGRVGAVRVEVERAGSAGVPGEAELQRRLKLGPGDVFDYKLWLQDRDRLQEALARAGYFEARVFATREPRVERGSAPEQPIALSYEVRTGPRTSLRFFGFTAPPGLRQRIEEAWWQGDYEASIETAAAEATRAFLVERGHVLAKAHARAEVSAEGAKELLVRVVPGPRAGRCEIAFEGPSRVPLARLEETVRTRDLLRAAFRDPDAFRGSLLELLSGEGLLAAKIDTRVELRGETAMLVVTLDEGPSFTLGAVSVSGASAVAEDAVRKAAGLTPGEPFRADRIAAAREGVRALYRSRGFVLASVKADGNVAAERASVDVALRINEGVGQVVQSVQVDGDAGLFGKNVASDFGLEKGDPVVLGEWSNIRRKLFETGLLRAVELRAEPIGEPAKSGEVQPVKAHLTLLGWPSLRLRYGLQLAGTRDPLIEAGRQQFRLGGIADLSRQTLFGRAVSAGLSAQARQGFLFGRGYLSLPRTFGAPLRSSAYLTRTRAELPIAVLGNRELLTDDTTDLAFEERLRLGSKLELAAAYGVDWTRLHGDVLFFGPVDLRLKLARLTSTAVVDGRDNVIDPLRGYLHATSFEYGAPRLGSDFTFNRLLVQQYVYVPAPGGTLLASGVRFERSAGPDQLFLTSGRLAAGGANSVRGYPEDFGGSALGGGQSVVSKLLLLNQEVRFPILGSLFGGAFFDHASRWEQDRGRVLSRSGVGFGLRFRTAVGVLRLDFGYPLSGEGRTGRFYFALGQAF